MESSSIADVIIVGAGPGGVSAAVQCKRLGLKPILLDETGQAGGLAICANRIENYPGLLPMNGREFAELLREHIRRFGILIQPAKVKAVDYLDNGFSIETDIGVFCSKTVVSAVGTAPKILDLPGAEYLKYSPLELPEDNCLTAAVIGGGEASLDYAMSLSSKGIPVTVLVRSKRLKASGLLVESAIKNNKINIVFGAVPSKIERNFDKLTVQFCCSSIKSIKVDNVIAAIGRVSRIKEVLKELDQECFETVSTPWPGLFVVGDARLGSLGQAGIAVGDGLLAAQHAAHYIEANYCK